MIDEPDFLEVDRFWRESFESQKYDLSLAGRALLRSHYWCEKTYPGKQDCVSILEVGCSSGRHIPFVNSRFDHYTLVDTSRVNSIVTNNRVAFVNSDARSLPFASCSFDRLVSCHVLEHIDNPVSALKEWNRVTRNGGWISIVLPTDPGLFWRLGRLIAPKWSNSHCPYDYYMAREHINSIFNLESIIKFHFPKVRSYWFPCKIPSADLNLFYICHIQVQK